MCQFESIHFDPAHIFCSIFPFFVIKDNDMHLGNFNDFFKCYENLTIYNVLF